MDGIGWKEVLVALLSAPFWMAVFAGLSKFTKARSDARVQEAKTQQEADDSDWVERRQDRREDIKVLREAIKELREDRDKLHAELRQLRNDYTKCLLEHGEAQARAAVQERQIGQQTATIQDQAARLADQSRRIASLEEQVQALVKRGLP